MVQAPVLFPLAAVFHIFWLGYTIWANHSEPFPGIIWLQVLWITAFTALWLWACTMNRKGAWGYIALTVADLVLYLCARNRLVSELYVSNIIFIDVLLSLGLLFYLKKME